MPDIHWDEPGVLEMYDHILKQQRLRADKGEETRHETFAYPLHFDLSGGRVPLLTTKKVQFKSLLTELLWFISGSTNVEFLHNRGVHIWDTWANRDGEVGPLYGYMWRNWMYRHPDPEVQTSGDVPVDQLANVIDSLRDRPQARSHVISAWRPDWTPYQSIKPCHVYLQFYRYGDDLELALTQRSCDAFLGVPFNLGQFSVLTHLIAHHLGIRAKAFHWFGMDVHIYDNHVEQVREQLRRSVMEPPRLEIKPVCPIWEIDDYDVEDFNLKNYNHHGALPASISPQGRPGQGTNIGVRWGNGE